MAVHLEVVDKVMHEAVEAGLSVMGLDFSPVKGPEGNIEYLMWISSSEDPAISEEINAAGIVDRSQEELQ